MKTLVELVTGIVCVVSVFVLLVLGLHLVVVALATGLACIAIVIFLLESGQNLILVAFIAVIAVLFLAAWSLSGWLCSQDR